MKLVVGSSDASDFVLFLATIQLATEIYQCKRWESSLGPTALVMMDCTARVIYHH